MVSRNSTSPTVPLSGYPVPAVSAQWGYLNSAVMSSDVSSLHERGAHRHHRAQ